LDHLGLLWETFTFTHFYYRLSPSQGHSAAGRIISLKNSNDTIGSRTRDLPACSVSNIGYNLKFLHRIGASPGGPVVYGYGYVGGRTDTTRHNITVRKDSIQESKNQSLYCLRQWPQLTRTDRRVVSQQLSTIRPNKVGLFGAERLATYPLQLSYDLSIRAGDKNQI